LDAVKSQKETLPDAPYWLDDLLLARRYNRFPWELEDGPLEWVTRLKEFEYQRNKQGIDL